MAQTPSTTCVSVATPDSSSSDAAPWADATSAGVSNLRCCGGAWFGHQPRCRGDHAGGEAANATTRDEVKARILAARVVELRSITPMLPADASRYVANRRSYSAAKRRFRQRGRALHKLVHQPVELALRQEFGNLPMRQAPPGEVLGKSLVRTSRFSSGASSSAETEPSKNRLSSRSSSGYSDIMVPQFSPIVFECTRKGWFGFGAA